MSGYGFSVGAVVSRTRSSNVPEAPTFPAWSVGVHVIVVAPIGNSDPGDGAQATVAASSRLSVAVGSA
jgi:hypothetical protein